MSLRNDDYYFNTLERIAHVADTVKHASKKEEIWGMFPLERSFQDERFWEDSNEEIAKEEIAGEENPLFDSRPHRPIMKICTMRQAFVINYNLSYKHNPLILISREEMDKCINDDLSQLLVLYVDFLDENPYCRGDLFTYLLYDFGNIGLYITDPQTRIQSLVIVV